MDAPSVSVCVLTWNVYDVLRESLPRIQAEAQSVNAEIIFHDQGSSDGTYELLRYEPGITVLSRGTNIGNSRARNALIEQSRGALLILLDGDIIPISGSFYALREIMSSESDYGCIGYDYEGYNWSDETPYEYGIKKDDLVPVPSPIALTQYGIFRRDVFNVIRFPVFPPFDGPGWGAEDDVVGYAIVDQKFQIGMVAGRKYIHHPHTSWNSLGKSQALSSRIHRAAAAFHKLRLPPWKPLSEKTFDVAPIERCPIPFASYHWNAIPNLGDVAFPEIYERYLPSLQFSPQSRNRFVIGGTVMDHHLAWFADKSISDNDEIVFFGTGVERDGQFSPPPCRHVVYPRGPVSEEILRRAGFNVMPAVGDTAFFLMADEPLTTDPNAPALYVADAFADSDIHLNAERGDMIIAVARSARNQGYPLITSLADFRAVVAHHRCVISSQIHPVLIALAWGVPACLIRKDLRTDDLESILKETLTDLPDAAKIERIRDQMNAYATRYVARVFEFCGDVLKRSG